MTWSVRTARRCTAFYFLNGDAYWDFADYIHSNRGVINSEKGRDNQFAALDRTAVGTAGKFHLDVPKLQACVKDPKSEQAVNASEKQGEALEVSGTPTMFINGQMLDGARPVSEIRAALDGALKRAGVAPPTPVPTQSASPSATGAASAKH
jgi:protein-disulfide isomerase